MPQDKKEQHLTIKILHGMNLSAKNIHQRLVHAHNQGAYSLSSVHRWVSRFAASERKTTDRARSRRPMKVTPAFLNQLLGILQREPKSSLQTLAHDMGVSVGTIHKVLHRQLRWKKRPACWIPHHLTDAQRLRRLNGCRTLLRMKANNRDFLRSIVTMDESWFFAYDPASRQASCEWIAPGRELPTHRQVGARDGESHDVCLLGP